MNHCPVHNKPSPDCPACEHIRKIKLFIAYVGFGLLIVGPVVFGFYGVHVIKSVMGKFGLEYVLLSLCMLSIIFGAVAWFVVSALFAQDVVRKMKGRRRG